MISIREAREEDAGALLQLQRRLDRESEYMLLEPDERTATEDKLRERLKSCAASSNSVIMVAAVEGMHELAGFVSVEGGGYRRNAHCGYIVTGVAASYAGQGVGTRLFEAMLAWREQTPLTRLELTVMTHNARAVALYKKMGFVVEGTKHRTLMVGGRPVDEFAMARLF